MEKLIEIPRPDEAKRINSGLINWPVTFLLGPRQCGKTWMVRGLVGSETENYFDMHDYLDRVRLEAGHFRILDNLEGLVVIDEAQEIPELFLYLRVLADRLDRKSNFILTGSASPELYKESSETLAGRVRILPLSGFSLNEVGPDKWEKLWLRGGFPKAFLPEYNYYAMEWRSQYIAQFLWKDVPSIVSTRLSNTQLNQLIQLVAHYHGNVWNNQSVGRQIGVSYRTVQRYIEVYRETYIVRVLPPYSTNAAKSLRKNPKIYLRDSGLLHTLLKIETQIQLFASPQRGHSWEGFCIEQTIALLRAKEEDCFYWSLKSGAELDLLVKTSHGLLAFEFKSESAPNSTKSMRAAIEHLNLSKLYVVYPGTKDYELDDQIKVIGIQNLTRLCSCFNNET